MSIRYCFFLLSHTLPLGFTIILYPLPHSSLKSSTGGLWWKHWLRAPKSPTLCYCLVVGLCNNFHLLKRSSPFYCYYKAFLLTKKMGQWAQLFKRLEPRNHRKTGIQNTCFILNFMCLISNLLFMVMSLGVIMQIQTANVCCCLNSSFFIFKSHHIFF